MVRCVYTVCVMRPYIPVKNENGKIAWRKLFRTNYSTPRTMFSDYVRGMLNPDETYREDGAFMGHAFARIESRSPRDNSVQIWAGQSGMTEADFLFGGAYTKFRTGVVYWHPFTGKRDNDKRCNMYWRKYYEKAASATLLDDPNNAVFKIPMLAVAEFRTPPEITDRLIMFSSNIHNYSRYALDSTTLKNVYRAGCATYIGMLTQYAGLVDVEKEWVTEKMMPLVVLDTIPVTWIGIPFVGRLPGVYQMAADEFCDNERHPHTANWGVAGDATGKYRSLKFVDPYTVSDWSDRINAPKPHRLDKARSVIIRYDVPNLDDLKSWERSDP